MLGLDRYSVPYHDAKLKGFEPDGWDVRGLPWVVRCDWLDLTFTNGFLYGLVSPCRLFLSPLSSLAHSLDDERRRMSKRRTFANHFRSKQDDEDNFRAQPDWHAPGLAEERISKLVKVHTDQLKYPPSFISLHSGRQSLSLLLLPLNISGEWYRPMRGVGTR